jgi:hypothetical protein
MMSLFSCGGEPCEHAGPTECTLPPLEDCPRTGAPIAPRDRPILNKRFSRHWVDRSRCHVECPARISGIGCGLAGDVVCQLPSAVQLLRMIADPCPRCGGGWASSGVRVLCCDCGMPAAAALKPRGLVAGRGGV